MVFELINPSDPYTFAADDRETAALAVFVLGTAYGAAPADGSGEDVPIFFFGGGREWYEEQFGHTPDEGMAALKDRVADALDSFLYGSAEDRHMYELATSAMSDPVKKRTFEKEWADRRSSLNDIGATAKAYARAIRERSDMEKEDQG